MGKHGFHIGFDALKFPFNFNELGWSFGEVSGATYRFKLAEESGQSGGAKAGA